MKPVVMGLLLLILLAAPGPALAKVPWSSVEIVPEAPVAGEPLTVVAQFWDDAGHTRPSTWSPDRTMDGLLEFEGAAGRVPLRLTRTGEATFHAEVTLSEGVWRLEARRFDVVSGPADVELATVTVAAAPDARPPIGAAVIGVALVTAGVIWRGRRSPSPIEHG